MVFSSQDGSSIINKVGGAGNVEVPVQAQEIVGGAMNALLCANGGRNRSKITLIPYVIPIQERGFEEMEMKRGLHATYGNLLELFVNAGLLRLSVRC